MVIRIDFLVTVSVACKLTIDFYIGIMLNGMPNRKNWLLKKCKKIQKENTASKRVRNLKEMLTNIGMLFTTFIKINFSKIDIGC